MSVGLQPYPYYKDSEVPWLGKVPTHWEMFRAKILFDRIQRPVRAEDEIVTCFRDGTVTLRKNRRIDGFTNALKEIGYQGVRKGELVIHVMDAFAGSIGVSDSDGKCSPVYSICHPKEGVNSFYYSYLIREMSRSGFIQALAKGIRERSTDFRYDMFSGLRFPLPSPDEQASIVEYWNYQERKIHKYILSKRKLIALLNEQKQAIIQRSVIRGLNPDVKLKPSGNSWLGSIPDQWRQRSLWTISKLRMERNPGGLQLLSVFLDRGVIRYEDGGGQVHAPSLDLSNYQVVHKGDFVLNNQQAWRGSVGVSSFHGIISPAYIVMNLATDLDPTYANYLMRCRAMVDQFVAASKGVGDIQRQMFWPFLRIVQVPVPELDEQRQIVKHLDAATVGINQAISKAERQVALMREYRARLLADVITGKVDVREAAARLPDVTGRTNDSTDSTSVDDEAIEQAVLTEESGG